MKLTDIARKTLETSFKGKKIGLDKKTKDEFKEKKATFVTLEKENRLRGCIGTLEARQELWKDVQENAINAAFNDFRFPQLSEEELGKIKISVSVLSPAKKINYKNFNNLLEKINNKQGIILKKDIRTATFLPQVWRQIPDKIEFLEQLSLKAGLQKDAWKNSEIWAYNVDVEEE